MAGTKWFHTDVIVKLREKYSFGTSRKAVYTGLNFYLNKENEIFVDQFDLLEKN